MASFATSYIPTTSSTVTRSADVASITGTAFSSWYRQDAGSLYAEGIANSPTTNATNQSIASLDDASIANRIQLTRYTGNGQFGVFYFTSGANVFQALGSLVWNNGATGRAVTGYTSGSQSLVANAALIDTSGTASTLPTVSRLSIGIRGDSAAWLNGTLRRVVYFPRRLPDVTLQALTQ